MENRCQSSRDSLTLTGKCECQSASSFDKMGYIIRLNNPARVERECRVALVENTYGASAAVPVVTTAPPRMRGASAATDGRWLASVYTMRFFWIGACRWMTKTIARCSKRISVRAAHAGASVATAMHSNWPRSAAVPMSPSR
ncbi:hypothetical protein BVI434_940020 [Burkholderia vietnamiensis]|nr:hypothetical protein BVI434_940020 [Burkholderia vietnamiensis]